MKSRSFVVAIFVSILGLSAFSKTANADEQTMRRYFYCAEVINAYIQIAQLEPSTSADYIKLRGRFDVAGVDASIALDLDDEALRSVRDSAYKKTTSMLDDGIRDNDMKIRLLNEAISCIETAKNDF